MRDRHQYGAVSEVLQLKTLCSRLLVVSAACLLLTIPRLVAQSAGTAGLAGTVEATAETLHIRMDGVAFNIIANSGTSNDAAIHAGIGIPTVGEHL